MRKIITKVLCFLVILCMTGCQKSQNIDTIKYKNYLAYYDSILNAKNMAESSEYFDVELVVNKLGENEYRYDMIIDNAKVAMYNIKALAIIDVLETKTNSELMMPSIGIIDDSSYRMVPNQVDIENNFVPGLDLSVVYDKPACRMSLVIVWNDRDMSEEKRQYISLYQEYQEPLTNEENKD